MSSERTLERLPLGDRLRRRLRRDVVVPLERSVGMPLRRALNAGRTFRPVFVAGAMGSGTTLLALSLGQKFDCACVIEEGAIQIDPRSFLHAAHSEAFASVRAYQEHMTPKPDWSVERGREDMEALYRSYARGPSSVVIDKGPNAHLLRVAFLRRCFPDACFAMIFRDPVATIEGFRRKWGRFGEAPIEESIRFYREIHERFLEEAADLGERVAILRYEELLESYEGMIDSLGRRFRLEAARRPRRLRTRANVEGPGIRNVKGGRIGLVAATNERAYARLDAATIERVRDRLGPLHGRMCALAGIEG